MPEFCGRLLWMATNDVNAIFTVICVLAARMPFSVICTDATFLVLYGTAFVTYLLYIACV